MAPRAWQRAWVWVNDPTAAPLDLLRTLRPLGFRRIILPVHHHWVVQYDVSEYVAELRADGWFLTGWGWCDPVPTTWNPDEWDAFEIGRVAGQQLVEHQMVRYIANPEDAYKWTGQFGGRDEGTPGRFAASRELIAGIRSTGYRGRIACCTYPGVDLDHAAWRAEKGPMYVQAFRTGEPVAWGGIKASVDWAVGMGWPRARVKPLISCFKGSDGFRADPYELVLGCRSAGTLGIGIYYAEGAFDVVPSWWQPIASAVGADPGAIAR